jgi:hypothetical protein
MNVDLYHSLPETLDAAELKTLFVKLLQQPVRSRSDALNIAVALCELADRQWHNFELVAPEIADLISDWIVSNWDPHSSEFISSIGSVVGMLGLPRALAKMEESLHDTTQPALRAKLEKIIAHLKPTIDDPYSGMRRGK